VIKYKSFLGARSLVLLENAGTEEYFPDGEKETHRTFDLLNDEFHLPTEKTYYNCKLHKLPEFTEKQHLVKVINEFLYIKSNFKVQ